MNVPHTSPDSAAGQRPSGERNLEAGKQVPDAAVWTGRFAGKGFVVTGAGGGIGRAVTERVLAEGGTVLATDVRPPCDDGHERQHNLPLDVRDPQGWADVLAYADEIGAGDGLVLCHGVAQPLVPTADLEEADWRTVLDINLTGCFLGVKAILPRLEKAGWGRIMALASIAAKEANALEHAYAASKAGLVALVKSVGKELATSGVTVNAIAPGPVGTDLFYSFGAEHNADRMRRTPMGRPATPEETASLIAWLLSAESSYSTAQCFDLSGGRAVY
ncbi:SDR family NAD(P)-dependent oxidoreductase [Saccharopolyspora sp. ASAGF58]|uniref:SDR family NAD(P)-dependent oxidoreductase n=1 Tax=Saccharopolyspora sp. ASAGF58 TaxID=2719023 RepID=UPI00143FEBAE|nr:SDR family NAD(P)-dependent oxidoreductase [Saccharopolyspora sp. ASAGF58]QIZ37254.1 SDR family oxidoreductase [Saccharopolyspora sp. ASAGF58]